MQQYDFRKSKYDFRNPEDPQQAIDPMQVMAEARALMGGGGQDLVHQADPGAFTPRVEIPPPTPVAAAPAGRVASGGVDPSAGFKFDPAAFGDWRKTITPDEAFIISHESGFRPNAYNKTVVRDQGRDQHAFGLGQLIDENREFHARKLGIKNPNTLNPFEQLAMMRSYINGRYGSAANARRRYKVGVGY